MNEELLKRGGEKNLSKREICAGGMAFFYAKTHNWTSCAAVGGLRGLWELEQDPDLKADFAKGLTASARLAAESLPLSQKFDNSDTSHFEMNWRVMNAEWKPQSNEKESQDLAMAQLRNFMKLAPRRGKETAFIREPTAAAWIVSLVPDAAILKSYAPEVGKGHFPLRLHKAVLLSVLLGRDGLGAPSVNKRELRSRTQHDHRQSHTFSSPRRKAGCCCTELGSA
jgi:hypothetical protein